MTVTYGFYNSVENDRRYNSLQMSRLFDGIIKDGVFMSIGNHFSVTAGTGLNVLVGTGKAWFNHTWTENDAPLELTVDEASASFNRFDAVILEINSSDEVRANSFKILKGVPATNPVRPTLTNTETVHQYLIADIIVYKNTTQLYNSYIYNKVGMNECPFISGIMQTIDVTTLFNQWQNDLVEWKNGQANGLEAWLSEQQAEFDNWFSGIVGQLSTDAAGNLQTQITNLIASVESQFNALVIPTPSTGSEIDNGGTEEDINKFVSPVSLNQSHWFPHRSPAHSGDILVADGTDWVERSDYLLRLALFDDISVNVIPSGPPPPTFSEFRTIQDAIDYFTEFDLNGHEVTINVADGSYSGDIELKPFIGSGYIKIIGNLTNRDNVIVNAANGICFRCGNGGFGQYSIRGMKLAASASSSIGISAAYGYHLDIDTINFGSFISGYHMKVSYGGRIIVNAPGYSVSGPCLEHVHAEDYGHFISQSIAIAFSTNPTAIGTWLSVSKLSIAEVKSITFTNKAYVTGRRYTAALNGIIDTGSGGNTSYLPGNISGVLTNGGQYV